MKIKYLIYIFILLQVSFSNAQVAFYEDFEPREGYEGGTIPYGWSEEFVKEYRSWTYREGGHQFNPENASNGLYNALFLVESHLNQSTKLITPPIDISYMNRPRLKFNLAMMTWWFNGVPYVDELKIYYKTSFIDEWKLVNQGEFELAYEEWTEVELYLDSTDLSSTYYIAFEGKTGYGHGICIDEIVVEEAGVLDLRINEIEVTQATTDFVASGTENNQILRYKIQVVGNEGTLNLESLTVASLNSNDADVLPQGVKLFYTSSEIFNDQNQIASSASFVDSLALFENINLDLEFGYHYFWITYDISSNATHGNSFDAKVPAGSIIVNGTPYPAEEMSPPGNRSIYETLFIDGFETDLGWTIGEGFSIDTVRRGGGWGGGHPKPATAAYGVKVLGTNLQGGENVWDFDYAPLLEDREYYAISPEINCFYYRDVSLSFARWLNIEIWDNAYIDITTDNGDTWQNIWASNSRYFTDSRWTNQVINISEFADRQESVKIRFALGTTNGDNQYSGWNIDNFILTGNFLDSDVAVTEWIEPRSMCGHTNEESITVKVVNYAGKPTADIIPIGFSLDGGNTVLMDTIFGSLPIGGDTIFTFHIKADLSIPGNYQPYASTYVEDDEEIENNFVYGEQIFAIPTYSVPFVQDFESSNHLWKVTGKSTSSWEWAVPRGNVISAAGSGYYSWVTKRNGNFNYFDSSYVMSPCVDFTGVDFPVFDFKTISVFNDNISGAQLQYSLDQGETWSVVPRNEDKWNWYNTTESDVLLQKFGDGQGWNDSIGEWVNSKHLLPFDVRNNKNVRFRIGFASTSNDIPYEGFAFDLVKVYDAPADLGVVQILSPLSACELSDDEEVVVTVQNFGLDTLEIGQEIIVALDVNQITQIIDTFNLTNIVLPNETFEHTFSINIDFSLEGNYELKAYTLLPEDINFFDNYNDTLIKTVSVYGMPNYNLGANFGVLDYSVGITIDAGQFNGQNFASYEWDNGHNGRFLSIDGPGMYYVTVTNDSACVAMDSIYSYLSAQDLGIVHLFDLESNCQLSDSEEISVSIKNLFTDAIYIDDEVYVGYKINNRPSVIEPLVLITLIEPGDSITFTFDTKANLSQPGIYNLKLFTVFDKDFDFTNDTLFLSEPIINRGATTVSLNQDTLFVKNAEGTVLTASNPYPWNPFTSVIWHDSSTELTYTIPSNRSGIYYVNVEDTYGCGTASDSVVVLAYDISIDQVIFPQDVCMASDSENIHFILKNLGTDTLEIGTNIPVEFELNNVLQTETIVLNERFLPDSTIEIVSVSEYDVSEIGTYFFNMKTLFPNDIVTNNNIKNFAFNVWGYPNLDIGADTIYTTQTDTLVFDATATATSTYLWHVGSSYFYTPTYTVGNRPNITNYKVTVTDNGCSVSDSVLVWTQDLSMISINKNTSYCELSENETISITMRNNGVDMIRAGAELKLGIIINDTLVTYEDFITTSNIFGMSNFQYTFSNTFNMSNVGLYDIKAFFQNTPKNVEKYNDTISLQTMVYGYPTPDIGYDTIVTSQPDTITLRVSNTYATYQWQDGHNSNVYNINSNSPGWYSVTVTWGPGCRGGDSVRVISWDTYPTIVEPQSSYCEGDTAQQVIINIRNSSIDIIEAGTIITVGFLYNQEIINEEIILDQDIAPMSFIQYTFDNTINTSDYGTHPLKVWMNYSEDAFTENDTISNFEILISGIPTVDLGTDTIFSVSPIGIDLEPIGNFVYYTWSETSATPNQPLTVSKDYSQWYKVTVYDNESCVNQDSLFISTSDVSIDSIISPISLCDFSDNEAVSFVIKNEAKDTLPIGTEIFVNIYFDNTEYNDTIELSTPFFPEASIQYDFNETFDFTQNDTNYISISIILNRDSNIENNSVDLTIPRYIILEPNLIDSIFTTQPDTVKLFSENTYAHYLWSDGSENDTLYITSIESNTYHLTVTDENGCEAYGSTIILNSDVAYHEFLSPTNKCRFDAYESVRFSIINNGSNPIDSGTEVKCYLEISDTIFEEKIITLSHEFNRNDVVVIQFDRILDLSDIPVATIKTYFSIPGEVYTDNDTSVNIIYSWGYPEFDLGDQILFTSRPDTLSFELPENYESYVWQDGTDSRVYNQITPMSAYYSVTVSNEYGCESSDTILIVTDLASIDSLLSPVTQCLLSDSEELKMKIYNHGAASFSENDILILKMEVNGVEYDTESIVLLDDLLSESFIEYTSNNIIDMSIPGEYNINFKVFFEVVDTILLLSESSYVVEHLTLPNISINEGLDTIKAIPPFDLNVADGYEHYYWNGIVGTNTITATGTGKYIVTVVANSGCSVTDSVYVLGFDYEIIEIASPYLIICENDALHKIALKIFNNSADTLFSNQQIEIGFDIDGLIVDEETITLTENWNPKDTLTFELNENIDFSAVGNYSISAWLVNNYDLNRANDSISIVVESYPVPRFRLNEQGFISIEVKAPYTLSGPSDFNSYLWSNGETSKDIEITETSTYVLTVTDDKGCSASRQIEIIIIEDTGWESVKTETLKIYPIPATDIIKIENKSTFVNNDNLKLLTNDNKLVLKQSIEPNSKIVTIDVSNIASGIYYLHIYNNNNLVIREIIIK
jgi:hypothetical protein